MVTRFRVRSNRPTQHFALIVPTIFPPPKSYSAAYSDSNWHTTMLDEYNALIKHNTWTRVPCPSGANMVFNDSNWQNAMYDEYNALIKNNTWMLVPRPKDLNIFRSMWLFKHKHLADGTLSRYKARLVANDSTQLSGIDVEETFSLVVKPAAIQTRKYADEILERAHMVNCNPSRTPIDIESKLGANGYPVSDSTLYRSLADADWAGFPTTR
nr:ribonuclease H-like domain-containing protein [Tanacetum cinerariifolium]